MSDTSRSFPIFWVGLAVFVGVAVWAALSGFSSVDYTTATASSVATQLLSLVFVALVIERAVEVVVNNRYGQEELVANRDIRLARAQVDAADAAISSEMARIATSGNSSQSDAALQVLRSKLDAANTKLLETKRKAQPVLERIHIRKRGTATVASLSFGLLVAVAGVHIFSNLVTAKPPAGSLQLDIFLFADIVVTAMLLAGGADGIHQIIKSFTAIDRDVNP